MFNFTVSLAKIHDFQRKKCEHFRTGNLIKISIVRNVNRGRAIFNQLENFITDVP